MIKRLKNIYNKEMFRPSILGVFINPLYFIRSGIYNEIIENARFIKGIMLDFGCGKKPYKSLFNVNTYIGLEIFISDKSEMNKAVDVFYDGISMPFTDNSIDCVFSSEVFEHIFNLEHVLSELYRIIKPNGYIFITLPFVWEEHEAPHDFARYSSFGIEYLLTKHGFKIVVTNKLNNYIETIFQLLNSYIIKLTIGIKPAYRILFNCIFIAPITIFGIIASKLLPKNYDLYLTNIIIARKPITVIKEWMCSNPTPPSSYARSVIAYPPWEGK